MGSMYKTYNILGNKIKSVIHSNHIRASSLAIFLGSSSLPYLPYLSWYLWIITVLLSLLLSKFVISLWLCEILVFRKDINAKAQDLCRMFPLSVQNYCNHYFPAPFGKHNSVSTMTPKMLLLLIKWYLRAVEVQTQLQLKLGQSQS